MAKMSLKLRNAVERLAASPQEQEAYLRRLGTAPSADELALEFSDSLIVEQNNLDEPARHSALLLDQYLTKISGSEKAELWTVKALYGSSEWAHVRQLATDVLAHGTYNHASSIRPAAIRGQQMDELVDFSTPITVMQAYMAMFKYIEHLQKLTRSDDLAGILGGMSLLGDDQVTADPAAWADWIRIVRAVRRAPPDIALRLKNE